MRSKVVLLLAATAALLLSVSAASYAQLGTSDTTGLDTVYFYSSGWCAKVDVYASSDNVYAAAGEFCAATAPAREAGDSLMALYGASCAATPLSPVDGANPDPDSLLVPGM